MENKHNLQVGQKVWIKNTFRNTDYIETKINWLGRKYFKVDYPSVKDLKISLETLTGETSHHWKIVLDMQKQKDEQEYYRLQKKIGYHAIESRFTLEELREIDKMINKEV